MFGQPVFDMAPPGTDHGAIQANLARLVGNHLERQSGRWSATERVDADGLLALPPVGFEGAATCVLHKLQPGLARHHPRPAGSQTVNVAPSPSRLSIANCPRWRLMMCFTIASPSPVPPTARDRPVSTR